MSFQRIKRVKVEGLKCKSVSQTNSNQNNILYVYIGPAAICPCPNINSQLIVITGDQGVWVEPLIQLRSQKVARGEDNVQIKHNIIGKSGTTKTWYSFNHPFLNGILPKDSINWCNPACNIESTSEDEITSEKLEILIQESGFNAEKIYLCIAQGNPILTIKRAQKLLPQCIAIDLSLHPHAEIWQRSIDQYLSLKSFKRPPQTQLYWAHTADDIHGPAPLMQPSQSELFLNKTIRILLNSINLENYREDENQISDLELSRLIAIGERSIQSNQSIRNLLSIRLKTLFNRVNFSSSQVLMTGENTIKGERINAIEAKTSNREDSIQLPQGLRGNIDSLDKNRSIRGWVDSSDFGEGTSEINVIWKEHDRSIAIGLADIDRPDLKQIGIVNTRCGFSIEISEDEFFRAVEDPNQSISLCLIESKSGQIIGNAYWQIPEHIRKELIPTLRGQVDGFEGAHKIRGWVDSSDFGKEISELDVLWKEQNRLVGKGIVNIDRPDLLTIGLQNTQCGFSIELELFRSFTLIDILDGPISLSVIEHKSGQLIGEQPWEVTDSIKVDLLDALLTEYINEDRINYVENYLYQSSNSFFTTIIRRRILEISAIRCRTGRWNESIISLILRSKAVNQQLDYGSNSESASRLELLLLATILLTHYIDKDKINQINIKEILGEEFNDDLILRVGKQLKERQFIGLQGWERRFWQHYLRPINFALIATLFLQSNHRPLNGVASLLDTVASVAEYPFGSNDIAHYIRSILNVQHVHYFEQGYIQLAQTRNDHFGLLLATYANHLHSGSQDQDIHYLAATIDFAGGAPTTYAYLIQELQRVVPAHLNANPKQTIAKHWIDRFGHLVSNETQSMVGQMLRLGQSKSDVIDFHNQMIIAKQSLAEMIWCQNNATRMLDIWREKSQSPIKRWLIIGEMDLTQCWMYRVEQKRDQLEQIGCDVRCIDHEDLKSWSFTHDMIWAEAVIVCRLPAMYHVFRAIAFARNCGLKVYAEIDDLLFTPDYPADYQSYGDSIPLSQYKNLCVDYPLRLGILNYADEIIVSTNVLAECCNRIIEDEQKPIHILPNLPLNSLQSISKLYQADHSWQRKDEIQRIALTSGTLSHKQILKETVYPAIIDILKSYPKVELTIIGHVDLPTEIQTVENRITIVPFTDYKNYLQLLNECTIMLVPLEVHPTTHGKSAIKWMEASLCGVTSICSPVRAYTDVTTNGEDVVIAESMDDWRNAMIRLLDNPKDREAIAKRAFTSANNLFNNKNAISFWSDKINKGTIQEVFKKATKKILVINVFFAPQSIGGATRVAQDYVKKLSNDATTNYNITVLCVDYANWQSGLQSADKTLKEFANESESIKDQYSTSIFSPTSTTSDEIEVLDEKFRPKKIDCHDKVHIDVSYWNGARVVRLNILPKPWHVHEDPVVDAFCEEFFATESFDLIQCHCCQILTASPLIVARRMSIPYEVILHDAWWMSHEQFLISAAGRVINPADPLDHFDQEPTEEERDLAFERRQILYGILEDAERRIAVSSAFKEVCELAGIADISVQENEVTSMKIALSEEKPGNIDHNYPFKICHIGGMSLHKGYQLLRQAVHQLTPNLPFEFTIIDHRLSSAADRYSTTWNGYEINFLAPIPMDEMPIFYSNHDVLIAPSIWPESFGLVSREALSAGLWVIASNSGALAEPILQSSQHVGKVIRPNQLQDLIDAIIEIPEMMKAKSFS